MGYRSRAMVENGLKTFRFPCETSMIKLYGKIFDGLFGRKTFITYFEEFKIQGKKFGPRFLYSKNFCWELKDK